MLSLGFTTCYTLNRKALRTMVFEGGYHDMTIMGPCMVSNVYDMMAKGGIYRQWGKCICNKGLPNKGDTHTLCEEVYNAIM